LPLYAKTSISQYADGVLSFYLLAALICLARAQQLGQRRYALLGGMFAGFLSFCKPEGLVAALILIGSFVVLVGNPLDKAKRPLLLSFLAGAGITLVPSL